MFQELESALDDTLDLPIRLPDGERKVYSIKGPDGRTGLTCTLLLEIGAMRAAGQPVDSRVAMLPDNEEHMLYEQLLGDSWQQMLDDGVDWSMIMHAGTTAMIWVSSGVEAAERYWNTGPKAPAQESEPELPNSTSVSSSKPRRKAVVGATSSATGT